MRSHDDVRESHLARCYHGVIVSVRSRSGTVSISLRIGEKAVRNGWGAMRWGEVGRNARVVVFCVEDGASDSLAL